MDVNKENSIEIVKWLENNIFLNGFLEDNYFEANCVVYDSDLSLYDSILEAVIHCPSYARFSARELNDSILNACQILNLSTIGNCFIVYVHDNDVRIVEVKEEYDLTECGRKLYPLYSLLSMNRSKEGGVTYAGLLGYKKEWMITFTLEGEGESRITIKSHGSEELCKLVLKNLKIEPNFS
ncbi:UNVERIFIED_CONTAM: hypothetical protein Cloal_1866 [Acetivibrio alkalicellulosi]